MLIDWINYLIHLIVLGQFLFFMYLYEKSVNMKVDWVNEFAYEYLFYTASLIFYFFIVCNNISYEFYKTHLIVQYIFLVLYAFIRFKKNNKIITAISLSFLIVFLNSYYWEIVLHFAEYNINPIKILNFRETIHLIVVPFLLSHYKFDSKKTRIKLGVGIFISFIASVITIEIIPRYGLYLIEIPFFLLLSNIVYFINRFISLYILIDIINNNTVIKENRKWWFR